ncbi:MAG TPA: c-type cytochrome [Flavipsychrobacter sp.]|nr:c-type cytochrome [Flavipsychrobacter sp.]
MKKVFKFLGILILVVVLLAIAGIGYVVYFLPNVGKAQDIKVVATPERVKRGEYLATSVAVCIDCHSQRDWTQYAGPYIKGTEGCGGEMFDQKLGFPGVFYARNITPYHLSNWTDGEIFRAITTGVSKDGHALFPIMPYHYYGQLDTEDLYSIIAYVRSLPAINNDVKPSNPDFPFSLIIHTIPTKASFHSKPSPNDSVAYGKYLVTMAGCVECHTPAKQGQIIPGFEFSGGREFVLPWGTIRTANITPDSNTGIGAWGRNQFVSRFKMYQDPNYHSPKLGGTDFNTIMPWMMYSRMTESDLASIYKYLRTLKPANHLINKFTPKS